MGNSSGLQIGQALVMVALPILLSYGIPRGHLATVGALVLPMLLSSILWIVVFGDVDNSLVMKSLLVETVAILPLVVAGVAVARGAHKALFAGVATAILTHAVIAAYQFFAFQRGEFPLLSLFQNPSFLQPTEDYARYVHRITGLFPEPSAMAASIGPWLILFAGVAVKGSRSLSGLPKTLFAIVAAAGVAMVLLSATGYSIVLIAILFLLFAIGLIAWSDALRGGRRILVAATLVCAVATAIFVAAQSLQPRLDNVDGLSWSSRAASMKLGLASLVSTPRNVVAGVGPGMSTAWMERTAASEASFGKATVVAVWSVCIRYMCETGLLSLLAIGLVLSLSVRAVRRSSERLIGTAALAAWMVSIALTTSYVEMEGMWLFLGLLLSWDGVFPRQKRVSVINGVRGIAA